MTQRHRTQGFLEKLTLFPGEVGVEDGLALRMAGIDEQATVDAIYVCILFNIIDRIADALDFALPSPEDFARTASNPTTRSYAPMG